MRTPAHSRLRVDVGCGGNDNRGLGWLPEGKGRDMVTRMSQSIPVERTTSPRLRPMDSELGFGKYFADHMFLLDHKEGEGWYGPRVEPYAPFLIDPAAAVLHYGQAMFDGMKAFRGVDGAIRLFRAGRHAQRMADGAARLCLPHVDPSELIAGIEALVDVDRDWVPSSAGTALYIRPTLIATEPWE